MGSSHLLHQQARGLLSRSAPWRATPRPSCSSRLYQLSRSQHQWQQEHCSSGSVRAAAAASQTRVLEADSKGPATVEEVAHRKLRLPDGDAHAQVEIKLRLPDRDAHAQVAELLKPHFRELHQQENFFFDGTSQEMSRAKLALRARFYGVDKHAVITLKGRQSMQNGVGIATELEEDVDPIEARTFLEHPDKLLQLQNSAIMESVRKQQQPKGLVCLGGFRNIRGDYDYEGLKLELDETIYEWGTCFEIEVETPDPEPTKAKLETLLKANNIPYKYNKTTKFANFRKGTLD